LQDFVESGAVLQQKTHPCRKDGLLTEAGGLTLSRSAANGLLTGTALGVVSDSRSYNSFGETTSYEATVNGMPHFRIDYTYDKLGRIISRTETLGSAASSYTYGYDEAGRLAEVQFNGGPLSSYAYDANGNLLRYHERSVTTEGAYDDQDRLLTYGSASYAYSPNGELASRTVGTATTTYGYDVLGNLRRVVLPNGRTIDYVIDAANRRIGKKVDGALVQAFLYQDQLKPVAELDGSGAVLSRFVYATRSNVPDYLVRDGVVYRIITDHLGSPRFVVNTSDGSIAQQMDYDAFGNVTVDTNSGFQPFGFAGGLYDRDTGLVRLGARDYDPHTGRWTAKDPILFAGGDTNLYGYVQNDPVNWVDPWGLYSSDDFLQDASNFSAGFGDTLTSGFGLSYLFGLPSLTEAARRELGVNDVVDPCSGSYKGGKIAGYAWGVAFNAAGYATGYEFTVGRNLRIAPWGNRTGHPYGELPHYHRRIVGPDGSTVPGGGIRWHRPWERGW
jgi:RHS repeat-associated protein